MICAAITSSTWIETGPTIPNCVRFIVQHQSPGRGGAGGYPHRYRTRTAGGDNSPDFQNRWIQETILVLGQHTGSTNSPAARDRYEQLRQVTDREVIQRPNIRPLRQERKSCAGSSPVAVGAGKCDHAAAQRQKQLAELERRQAGLQPQTKPLQTQIAKLHKATNSTSRKSDRVNKIRKWS